MGLLQGKPVVVPWDFSAYALDALLKAVGLVKDPSLVHAVYVMQIPVASEPGILWETVSQQTMHEQARAAFQRLVDQHAELAAVKFVSLIGDPGAAATDYAREQGAELIVISSHGRTGFTRWMLGSVAERVVRLATCPVLVLKKEQPAS